MRGSIDLDGRRKRQPVNMREREEREREERERAEGTLDSTTLEHEKKTVHGCE